MKKNKLFAGLLAAAMLTAALPGAAFAAHDGLLIAPRPENVTIAPRPENPLISPNPDAPMTRGQLVTRLWEQSGKPVVNFLLQFEDVTEGTDEAEAIRWAVSEQLAAGYGDGKFGAADPVTREQLATVVYHYVQKFGMGFQGSWMFYLPAEDKGDIAEWAFEPIMWLVAGRLLDGDSKLLPQEQLTVAQADALLTGVTQRAAEKGVDFADYGKTEQ